MSKRPNRSTLKASVYPRTKQLQYAEDCLNALNGAETIADVEALKTGYFVNHIDEIANTTKDDGKDFYFDMVSAWCKALLPDYVERANKKIERMKEV